MRPKLEEHIAIALFEDKTNHLGRWAEFHRSVKGEYRRQARIALKAIKSYEYRGTDDKA